MHVGARYYELEIGRFIQKDPILWDDNPYSYCDSSPVNAIDPLGLWSVPFDPDKEKKEKPYLWPPRAHPPSVTIPILQKPIEANLTIPGESRTLLPVPESLTISFRSGPVATDVIVNREGQMGRRLNFVFDLPSLHFEGYVNYPPSGKREWMVKGEITLFTW